MYELVLGLLVWITAQTGLVIPPAVAIEFVPQERMSQMTFGRAAEPGDDIAAAYDPNRAVVYLRDDWNHAELRSRARLLHELVHHVQAFNRVPHRCPADLEAEAYRLTLKWLAEQGVADPYETLGIDWLTVWLLSQCFDADEN